MDANQEKATKWETEKGIDGLTTNGVLLLHPKGGFNGEVPSACTWVEVSVGGALYHLRDSRSAPQKKSQVFPSSKFPLKILLLLFLLLLLSKDLWMDLLFIS